MIKLNELDPEMTISETIQVDLLLEGSGLSDMQILLTTTSVQNKMDLDLVATAMCDQHPRIHEKAEGFKSRPFSGGGGYRRNWTQKHKSTAYLADGDHDEEYEEEKNDDDEPDDECFYSCSVATEDDVGSIADLIEQDVVAAYICNDCDLDDELVCEEIAECVHDTCCSFFSREAARNRGVPVGKKIHEFKPRAVELTIQQRRDRIDAVKAKSTCRACGEKGHWAGDPKCKTPDKNKFKGKGQAKGKGKGKGKYRTFNKFKNVNFQKTTTTALR